MLYVAKMSNALINKFKIFVTYAMKMLTHVTTYFHTDSFNFQKVGHNSNIYDDLT